MDFINIKQLSEMLSLKNDDSSDSEDDLPKSSLVQLSRCIIVNILFKKFLFILLYL